MHSICNLRNKTQKEILVVFHNGSNYDHHFIIKVLTEEFKGQSKCIGENTEKYITFSVLKQKELADGKMVTYRLKCIDSVRFMPSSLSSLAYKLTEGLCKGKCIDFKPDFEYVAAQNNTQIFKCLDRNKSCEKEFNENLTK